jgi:hypothetical protein
MGFIVGALVWGSPSYAQFKCTKKIIAAAVVTAGTSIGVAGYQYFFASGQPSIVQMPEMNIPMQEQTLELFSQGEREYFFSVKKIYSYVPEKKFFNKNATQKLVARKINEKLIFHTPPPWKNNIALTDSISVSVEGILLRKRGNKVEALLVTPIGQYWFPKKIDFSELNSGQLITLEAFETHEHAIATGENKITASFYYDKNSQTVLMPELSMQLKLKLLGGFEQKDSAIFENVRAAISSEYTQRPEYGAFELDDDNQ